MFDLDKLMAAQWMIWAMFRGYLDRRDSEELWKTVKLCKSLQKGFGSLATDQQQFGKILHYDTSEDRSSLDKGW